MANRGRVPTVAPGAPFNETRQPCRRSSRIFGGERNGGEISEADYDFYARCHMRLRTAGASEFGPISQG